MHLNKVCDAADWFDPEFHRIVSEELREPARFHRKQWEFAAIFHALKESGCLDNGGTALSLGGGRERLLYSLAPHVARLVVTDLYDTGTPWDTARTENPDAFVRAGAPFHLDTWPIEARRMDMRQLDFEDESFDFAYSSCAVEHIGGWDDFRTHLQEVHRVLKPGGVYAFTTEFHYGDESLEHPGNFIFAGSYLQALLASTPFDVGSACDARITDHRANLPVPENFASLFEAGSVSHWVEELPHLQLLRGRYPFTSVLFVARKRAAGTPPPTKPITFEGLGPSRDFLDRGTAEYRRWVETSSLPLEPCSFLPGGRSAWLEGSASPSRKGDDAVFHSQYSWLGSGRRRFSATFEPSARDGFQGRLELRVHRFRTLSTGRVDCVATSRLELKKGRLARADIDLDVDDGSSYAFLANRLGGNGSFAFFSAKTQPL